MLRILYRIHFKVHRTSYTCFHLARTMQASNFPVEITTPSRSGVGRDPIARPVFPDYPGRVLGRINRSFTSKITEREYLRRIEPCDVAYLWDDVSTDLVRELKRRGILIVAEKFNGLRAKHREIIEDVLARSKLPEAKWRFAPSLEEDRIAEEFDQLALADYLFVANPIAADNFVRAGIPERKIIRSSYGWDPCQFGPNDTTSKPDRGFTLLFVGVADLRKGANLLIEAWVRAKVKGRLIIAGTLAPEIEMLCGKHLSRDDIHVTGWLPDVAPLYREVDAFAFPTHEEGGPQVTYEAMASGLPVIVSPMGAGAIARRGQDGFIIDPFDEEGWVEAIRKLATDESMRRQFAQNGTERAENFTWDKVGANRRAAVLSKI